MPGPLVRPRIRRPDFTRERILQAAFAEIYRSGYQSASLDAILDGAGVTKGALYHHFPSKAALGLAVVDEVITSALLDRWSGTLPGDPADPVAALQDVLRHRADQVTPEEVELGCPLNNLAQEMAPLDGEFRRRIDAAYERWIELFTRPLEAARRAGTLGADVDPRRLASFLVAAIEGSYSVAKGRHDAELLRGNFRLLAEWIGGLRTDGPTDRQPD